MRIFQSVFQNIHVYSSGDYYKGHAYGDKPRDRGGTQKVVQVPGRYKLRPGERQRRAQHYEDQYKRAAGQPALPLHICQNGFSFHHESPCAISF